jgi:hypothetical protein
LAVRTFSQHFGDLPEGEWSRAGGGKYTQKSYSDPTVLLSKLRCDVDSPITVSSSVKVTTSGSQNPKGFIGLAFGYRGENDFFLLDWKRYEPLGGGDATAGDKVAKYGITLKKVHANLTHYSLWSGDGSAAVIYSARGQIGARATYGWIPNKEFRLEVVYRKSEVSFTIESADAYGSFSGKVSIESGHQQGGPSRVGLYTYQVGAQKALSGAATVEWHDTQVDCTPQVGCGGEMLCF